VDSHYGDVAATGIAGLDDILCGGLAPYRLYLIEGVPGAGPPLKNFRGVLTGVPIESPAGPGGN
jgi:circadian clock protein KaiC